ncbi:hypothetical protein [Roseobacter sp.]|uniref:hypothetical protein n=1 Tax=Roseobacter sp. TaxID=1907202 RepID=UPI002966BD40|nr:hypothetical protein [Roseobacter sp.]MDW3181765.1 hypothetical protein [Roseobacter sp.]
MKNQQIGRLAMRVEGDLWVAYYAMPKTMKDALFLGSIQMAFVQEKSAKQIFMALMQDAVSMIIKEATGETAVWLEDSVRPAPAHERAGRA